MDLLLTRLIVLGKKGEPMVQVCESLSQLLPTQSSPSGRGCLRWKVPNLSSIRIRQSMALKVWCWCRRARRGRCASPHSFAPPRRAGSRHNCAVHSLACSAPSSVCNHSPWPRVCRATQCRNASRRQWFTRTHRHSDSLVSRQRPRHVFLYQH